MPTQKKNRTRKNKRRNHIANSPFPKTRLAKLTYYTEVELDSTGAVPDVHTFKANGMFDPDYSAAGHQPMGFDEYMALYNHFEVISSKMTARFIPSGARAYVGVFRADDSSSLPTFETLVEQPANKVKILLGASVKPQTITSYYSQKKAFGSRAKGALDQRGGVAGDPTELQYYKLWQRGINAVDPASTMVLVRIDYIAKFTEFKTLTGS